MRYLSVCSGIEAATVAWHPLGWQPAAFAEIEAFPRALLKHHYRNVPCHGDFTTIGKDDYGSVDLLVGGTPCQSFSVAGLRKGLADERGNLTLEFIRLVERKAPHWVVWENVPGVLSIDGGRAFGAFLGGLAECGYGFAYRILDAQYFGIPQRRRRVFVVGYLGDWRPSAAVLFERESLCGDITPRREARESVAPTISARTKGGGGLGTDFDCDGGLIPETAWALQERDAKGSDSSTKDGHLIPCYSNMSGTQRSAESDISLSLKTAGSNAVAIPIHAQAIRDSKGGDGRDDDGRGNGLGVGEPGDPANTLIGAEQHAVAFDTRNGLAPHGNLNGSEVVPTLRGKEAEPPFIQNSMTVRRLTPLECERLQGFPDGYTLVPFHGRPAADGNRYKALGNSMAVPVMRWIGERIQLVEGLMNESH